MKKRLFVAINLPEEIKNKISKAIEKIDEKEFFEGDSFRWLTPENWHLTITFLGWQADEDISGILSAVKSTAEQYKAPFVKFENFNLAPPDKSPRMIWLSGSKEISDLLSEIKNNLENNLAEEGVRFNREERKYNAHLTLARFIGKIDKQKAEAILEKINKELSSLQFEAASLDLIESELKRGGAEYILLNKFKFR